VVYEQTVTWSPPVPPSHTGSGKASRLAVSALCNLVPEPDDHVYARLLKDLTSARALALDNPRLEVGWCDVWVGGLWIVAHVSHPPRDGCRLPRRLN
jgi:hypothetical protein